MQVTEINTAGLKREYKITVMAGDIDRLYQDKLKELGQRVRLPGFRPGKAPVGLLKKQYGKAVMGEVLQETVSSATRQAMMEQEIRPALEPKIEVTKFEEGGDLEYTVAVEVMPEIVPSDLRQLKFEKFVAEVGEGEIDSMLRRLADQQKSFEKIENPGPAAKGEALVIDFAGSVDGVAFEGGSAKDYVLELGSGGFIPGFEDQLIGASVGAKPLVAVTFPADYGNRHLAGKQASFQVEVKELRRAKVMAIDDELAKRVGLQNLAELRDAVRKQIEQEHSAMTRARLKRALLDALSAAHDFAVPQGMVDMEFAQIWRQFQADPAVAQAEMAAEKKTEEEIKADYHKIAERRVRLGLLLAEIGRINNIEVKPDEVTRAMIEQARRFPGQERQIMEYFQKNPEALARLRAPVFEDKVVDFIVELADVAERKVSVEELAREPEARLA
jgi:trigger factor